MKHWWRDYIILLVFVYGVFLDGAYGQNLMRIRGTNRHYRTGDWVTYSSTRYVRHLCLSLEYVYFATTGGISRLNKMNMQWEDPYTVSSGLASDNIYLVAYDDNSGFLWCVHEYGVSNLGPASNVWSNYFYDEMGFYRGERVVAFGIGNDRKLYMISNQNRWWESMHSSGPFTSCSAADPAAPITWHENKPDESVLPVNPILPFDYWYNPGEKTISDARSRRYPFTFWLKDNWNNVWIATWGLGAARIDLRNLRYQFLPYGLFDPIVDVIAFDNQDIWLAGNQDKKEPAGITRWDVPRGAPEYLEPRHHAGFSDDRITAMAITDTEIWFGTHYGLIRYHRERESYRTLTQAQQLADDHILDLCYMDPVLYVATESGVSSVENKATRHGDSLVVRNLDPRQLRNMRVYDIEAQDDFLWIGTEYGLYYYDCVRDSGGFWRDGFDPADQIIYAIACYMDEVWFGTEKGIAGFNAKSLEWFGPPAQRFQNNGRIYRMAADGASVWAATDAGVFRYERQSSRWIHYTMEDGLPSQNIYTVELAQDYVWFGSDHGLTLFYWNAPYRID